MSRKIHHLVVLLTIAALIVAACGQATPVATEAPSPTDTQAPPPPVETQAPPTPTEAPPEPTPTEEMIGETYKIGFAPAITGPGASLGAPEHETGHMLSEQLNAQGGVVGPDGVRHPVEILIFDTETNPDVAVSVLRRMIQEENVHVVVSR